MNKLFRIFSLILFFIFVSLIFSFKASAQTPIVYGDTVTDSISAAGEKDEFTFSGTSRRQ